MLKKVSIIVPVYNATKDQLTTCINSVINQTYGNIELIIINDKSTNEETKVQLNKYTKTTTYNAEEGYSRAIKLYNNQQNIGISSSRNRGIDESTGEYICFLDQDDYYDPDYVLKLVEVIEAENADVAMCGFYSLDESGNILSAFPKDDMDIVSPWYPWSVCAIWNRIYRRDFIQQNNIRFPDGCVTEDIVFLMQCNSFSTGTAVIKEPLYRNVVRKASTSRSKAFHSLKIGQMPFKQIIQLLKKTSGLSGAEKGKACKRIKCSKYLYSLICNEMALLCFALSIASDKRDLKAASKQAGKIIRVISGRSAFSDICQYNSYCGDKKSMQVLILLQICVAKVHLEYQAALIVRFIIKICRGGSSS